MLALCTSPEVMRRCTLLWGVHAAMRDETSSTLDLIDECAAAAVEEGVARRGDTIGITAGLPPGRSGGTNLFKVHEIE